MPLTKPNQTSFKKGAKPGPGRPAKTAEQKAVDALTKTKFLELANKLVHLNRKELADVIGAADSSMLELMMASVIKNAVRDGDQHRIDFILNRIIGKVRDELELYGDALDGGEETDEEIDEAAK